MTTFSIVNSYGNYASNANTRTTTFTVTAGNILVAVLSHRTEGDYTDLTIADDNTGSWTYTANLANNSVAPSDPDSRIAMRIAWRVVEAGENGDSVLFTATNSAANNIALNLIEIQPSAAFTPSVLGSSITGSNTTTLDNVFTETGSISGTGLLHVFTQAARQGTALTYIEVDEYTLTTEYVRNQFIGGSNQISHATGVAIDGQSASGVVRVTSELGGGSANLAEGIIGQIVFTNAAAPNTGSGGVTTPLPLIAGATSGIQPSGSGAIATSLPSLAGLGTVGHHGSGGITTPLPTLYGTDATANKSDDFSSGALNTSIWNTVNTPSGTSITFDNDGTDYWVELNALDAANRDLYDTSGLPTAIYMWQDSDDVDLDLRVRFLTTPGVNGQGLGITVYQDDNNFARFDFNYNGTNYFGWASRVVSGATSSRTNTSFGGTWYPYMRVTRVGDTWTQYRSSNGTDWTIVEDAWVQAYTINKIGLHIISALDSTGFTGKFDYFEDYTHAPISNEDVVGGSNPSGSGAITTPLPTLSGSGARASVGTGAITSLLPALSGSAVRGSAGSGGVTTPLPSISGTDTVSTSLVTWTVGDSGSADFIGEVLDTGWSESLGDLSAGWGTFDYTGEDLTWAYNTGQGADPATGASTAGKAVPRIETDIGTGDFTAYFMVGEDPHKYYGGAYRGYGFVLYNSAGNSSRWETYVTSTGAGASVYANAAGTTVRNSSLGSYPGGINRGYPTHFKLQRTSGVIYYSCSWDGITWQQLATYDVSAIGADTLGVYGYQGSADNGVTFQPSIKHVHVGSQALPSLNEASLVRTTVWSPVLNDISELTDESLLGGSLTASGGILSMDTPATANAATRFGAGLTTLSADAGVLLKFRTPVQSSSMYAGIQLRANSHRGVNWTDHYGPPLGFVMELNGSTSLQRILSTHGDNQSEADGAYWNFIDEANVLAPNTTTWAWMRFEAVGPFVRARTWADGGSEPSTWDFEFIDATVPDAGDFGVAWSKNEGVTATAELELSEIDVYEITGVVSSASIDGSGAVTTPLPAISGSGAHGQSGSGSISTGLPALSGNGSRGSASSGSVTTQLPVLSGAGSRGSVGSGGVAGLLPILSGDGQLGHAGFGAIVSLLPILSGSSTGGGSGTGAVVTPLPVMSGSGYRGSVGTGAIASLLPVLSSDGSSQINISGVLHSTADVFGAGTLTQYVLGTLHSSQDWFGAGEVVGSGNILGSFHSTPDSFGQATLVPGEVHIDGVLHSTPDTFGAGRVQHVVEGFINGTFHSSPDTFGSNTAVQYIGGYFHSTADTFPIKRFVAFGSGLGVPLETWAEWQQLIRLPIMESDISDLQRDLWSLSAEFTNHVIENEYDFSVHSTLIGIADDKAEHAEIVADDVAAEIVSARFEAKAYTDTLIQLLRDELTAAFTAADTAVTSTLPATVETEIDAVMAQLQTDLDNARADALAAAALAQAEHAEMVSLTETMLFTTIPGLQNQADTATSAIDALRMEYDLLLTDFDEASLLAKFDNVDSEIAVSVANLRAVIEDPNGDSVGAALLSFQVAQTTINEATALDVDALQASVGDLDAYATAITDLNVNDLTGTAFATMLSDLEVDAAGNTAGISDFRAVEATLNDRSASVLAFETYTEGSNSFLRLGSYGTDLLDPAGNFAPHSNIYMKADDILLDGDVAMSKLTVTDISGNIVPNGDFRNGIRGWSDNGVGYFAITALGSSGVSPNELQFQPSPPSQSTIWSTYIPVSGGEPYTFSFRYWRTLATGGSVQVVFYDKDLVSLGGWAQTSFTTSTWSWVSQVVTAPAGALYAVVFIRNDAGSASTFYVTGVSLVRQRSGTTLIKDGTILTQHMTANSIAGDRIQANTMNATKITAGTIAYDRLIDNTLNGNTSALYNSGYAAIGQTNPIVSMAFYKYANSSMVIGAQGWIRVVMGTTMDYLYVRIRNFQNSEEGRIAIPVVWDNSFSMDLYVGFCAPFIWVPGNSGDSVSFGVEAWTQNGKTLLANSWKIAVMNNYHG